MSPSAATWCVLVLASAPQVARTTCTPAADAVLEVARRQVTQGDYRAATEALRRGTTAEDTCVPLRLAAWSTRGWIAALDAADAGGTVTSLAQVTPAIEVLSVLGDRSSTAAYAAALLHAASAAAQDERDVMVLWLDHARDLASRLTVGAGAPAWPLPIDLAEGELWRGVDDYELAEVAYARSLAREDTPAGWFGLAQARAGRGNEVGACEAYRQVDRIGGAAPDLAAASARARQRCSR